MGWQDDQVATVETPKVPTPAWARDAVVEQPEQPTLSPQVVGGLRQHFQNAQAHAADSFEDYVKAGWQQSSGGLALRGKAPDIAVSPDSPWYGRLTANLTGMAGDVPAMVAGYALGSAITRGNPIGGFAGANMAPAAIRTALMDSYTLGEVHSAQDFIDRAMHVVLETSKAGIVGAATGYAGKVAGAFLPAGASAITKATVPTAAQIATMTTVGKALEGELPEPQDFLDAAIMIGGLQLAGNVAGRLRTVYAKTGVPPQQVVADAARNPELRAELTAKESVVAAAVDAGQGPAGQVQLQLPGIPKAYQVIAQRETANAIVPGAKAGEVAAKPFALELPQVAGEPAKPTHVNYNLINAPTDTKLAMARLSEVYEREIQTQRRGTVSWAQTSHEAGKALSDALGGVDTKLIMPREPGTPAGAAELLARKQMVVGAAEAMMGARDNLLAKGAAATMEDKLQFVASIERSAMIQSEFLGARAEAGRALNILKSTAMDARRVSEIQKVIDIYGKGDPVKLAEMMKQIDNPTGALRFAREAVKATTFEKVIEAWKAGLVSGPVTHMANIIGNKVFAVMRVPVDAVAAAIGRLHGGERVAMAEPVARLVGLLQGTADGAKVALATFKEGESATAKAEHFRPAIGGKAGDVIRTPFKLLSAEDALFKTMNQRGEAYTLATRQATAEGLNPLTREFRERVVNIAQNPTPEMAQAIDEAATRFTFNAPLGEKGQMLQRFVRGWHLEWAVPFIRTPGNILKEMTRLTPAAPFVKEWREAVKAGGVARDKALAELAVGTAISSYVFMEALNGNVSGSGEPDPGKRRVQQAAGWQPYSVKINGTWYSYQRIQPIGTLMGMAADVAEVWDHMTEDESDKVPKMLSVAFANAVTNQTALAGLTSLVQVMSDPVRYGPKFLQQYAGSVVPNIVAQPTVMTDPVVRQVNGMVDAIKSRIPGIRGELLPQRDVFGESIQTKERLGAVSPVTETSASEDKVRTEAARLGLSLSVAPKKIHLGRGSGKIGDVKLEPEERDRFAEVGGKLAHAVLEPMVNSPGWDNLPDLVKRRTYQKVFLQAHKVAAAEALPPEKRLAAMEQITERMAVELAPAEAQ